MKERRSIEKTKLTINITTLVIIVLFVISTATIWATWRSDVDNKIRHNININDYQDMQIDEIKNKEAERDNLYTEMNTNIKWIMETLNDIKEEMK